MDRVGKAGYEGNKLRGSVVSFLLGRLSPPALAVRGVSFRQVRASGAVRFARASSPPDFIFVSLYLLELVSIKVKVNARK